jgi:hypothetical protein
MYISTQSTYSLWTRLNMSRTEIESYTHSLKFNRTKTLQSLEQAEKLPNSASVLGWRPGAGRAHCAWQWMHIAVTEELFATARLFGKEPGLSAFVERFRGGSTPDDEIPNFATIRESLETSRNHLLTAIEAFTDADLNMIPEPIKDRGWSLRTVLHVLTWHESHHQGQIHLTLNLWKNQP